MKKIVLSSSIVVIILVIILSMGSSDIADRKMTFPVNKTEKAVLNFGTAKVRVTGWDKDYVEIRPDEYLTAANIPFDLENGNNQFVLEGFRDITYNKFLFKNSTWMLLSQIQNKEENFNNMESGIYDFEIMIPRDVPVELSAKKVKAFDCLLCMVDSPEAEIRDCRLTENYVAAGRNAEVRNTVIGDNAYFKNHTLTIRECKAENIIIGTEAATGVLDAEIRELNGSSVTLEARESNDLSFLVRDSEFDSFTVNAPKDNTDIQLRSNTIGSIINNSECDIRTGDWNGWRY